MGVNEAMESVKSVKQGQILGHILIVEDDADLADITKVNLNLGGYTADHAYTCREAEQMLETNKYDCILMDMMLPDDTGDRLCKAMRARYSEPVIFISCIDDNRNIINALNCGGDDYVTKPVNYEVLLARIDANIRRFRQNKHNHHNTTHNPQHKKDAQMRQFNSFTIDTLRRRVIQDGKEVCLSSIEYSLLLYMSEHPDTLLLYNDLYSQVWECDGYGDIRTVMVHISNLRKKICSAKGGIIETVRGAGYIFCDV